MSVYAMAMVYTVCALFFTIIPIGVHFIISQAKSLPQDLIIHWNGTCSNSNFLKEAAKNLKWINKQVLIVKINALMQFHIALGSIEISQSVSFNAKFEWSKDRYIAFDSQRTTHLTGQRGLKITMWVRVSNKSSSIVQYH